MVCSRHSWCFSPRIIFAGHLLPASFVRPMAFEEIINKMKSAGRFNPRPTFTSGDLDQWEKDHSIKLSPAFREILTAGTYEIANFYFHPLKEIPEHPGYSVFAKWNDDEFGFKSDGSDDGVFVLLKGEPPYRKFESFEAWFRSVVELTARTNNPE